MLPDTRRVLLYQHMHVTYWRVKCAYFVRLSFRSVVFYQSVKILLFCGQDCAFRGCDTLLICRNAWVPTCLHLIRAYNTSTCSIQTLTVLTRRLDVFSPNTKLIASIKLDFPIKIMEHAAYNNLRSKLTFIQYQQLFLKNTVVQFHLPHPLGPIMAVKRLKGPMTCLPL